MASAYPQHLNEELVITGEIGRGAYGTVHMAKFLGCDCAVKCVHTAPLAQIDQTSLKKFGQECELMNSLRHPNLVQSIGTLILNYPILVMERMDCDLTRYLENNPNMGFNMEVSIANDIINGIRFLHHKGLVHRDLSGANVLMLGSRAKISDLGMAKLLSAFQLEKLTPCPGHEVYMPLLAVLKSPSYSEKIDIYCYGVLLIQIVTKKYPQPSQNIWKEAHGYKVLLTEVERRQNHMSEISDDHILKQIAIYCLNDDEGPRPSAIEIQKKMEEIKATQNLLAVALPNLQISQTTYVFQLIEENRSLVASKATDANCIQQLTERVGQLELGMEQQNVVMEQQKVVMEQQIKQQKVMEQQKVAMEKQIKQQKVVMEQDHQKKTELEQSAFRILQEAKQKVLRAQEKAEEAKQEVYMAQQQAKQEIDAAQNQAIQEIDAAQEKARKAEEKEQQVQQELLKQIHIHSASFSSISTTQSAALLSVSRNSSSPELSFDIIDSVSNPSKMHQDCTAVVVNSDTIYVRPARTRRILAFSSANTNWSLFPLHCEVENSALAFILNSLVTIGGISRESTCVNTLYRAIDGKKWISDLPPMIIARELPLSCTSGKLLIIIGGRNKRMLNVVEIFHEESRQWQIACCIPYPLHFASIAIFDESLVVTGIKERASKETHHISCKLTDLTYSANGNKDAITSIWKEQSISIPPKSSLSKFSGHLLAIGGQRDNEATGSVYSYCPELDNWQEVTTLNNHRYLSFTAVISEHLYVIGGDTGNNSLTDSIEIGTYQ